jgi:hypothetical protein
MAERELSLILRLKDQASQELSGFSGKLDQLQPTFRKMAAVGTAAFVGITAVIYKSTKAYAEVERANRQLEHAVIGVSKGTKEQVKAISDASIALEKKVGLDGEALKIGAAQLSTFGLQSKSVVDLTKSLADFTVNQNGLNASSEQYIASANIMQRAMKGQFGRLELMGVRFTEAQKEIILFGTESEKVAAIQEGFAQNLRETTDTVDGLDVAMAKAARNSEAVQDALGKALAPVIISLSETLLPLIERFAQWAEENPQLVKQITIAAAGFAALVAVLGFLGMIIIPLKAGIMAVAFVLGAILTPIGLVIASIIAIIAVVAYWIKNWEEIKETIVWTWEIIKEAFGNAVEWIKGVFKDGINFLIGLAEGFANAWVGAINAVIDAINSLKIKIPEWVPIFGGKSWNANLKKIQEIVLPRLAEGGIVTRPTTALIGEAGAEAVIPLKKMGMMGGVTVNVYGDVTGRDVVEYVKQAIMKEVKSYNRI